ncbi:MAG: hypothetical protein ACE5E6_02880 [Phycisphaerae bacterium]
MQQPDEDCIVDEFRLSGPLDEFTEHSRRELQRARAAGGDFDEARFQEAVELVRAALPKHPAGDTA